MIGGARTFKYYVDLERFKLNLAGQELKDKKFDTYQEICFDLGTQRISISKGGEGKSPLTNAVLNFYDLSIKRKNSDKIEVLESRSDNGTPDNLIGIIDNLWEGISHPTLGFLRPDHKEINSENLEYNGVREELSDKSMKYTSRDAGAFIVKSSLSLTGLTFGPFIVYPQIGIPVTILGAIGFYDSLREYIVRCKYEKKDRFLHEKEFRKLFHCARDTDKCDILPHTKVWGFLTAPKT